MNWQEKQNHLKAEANCLAIGRRPTQQNPWGREPYSCGDCGGFPLSGYHGASLDDVMAASVRLGNVVWYREVASGALRVACGVDHWNSLVRAIERGSAGPGAVERVTIQVRASSTAKPAAFRSVAETAQAALDTAAPARPVGCACGDPAHSIVVRATSPAAVEKVLVVSGWVRTPDGKWWSSGDCLSRAQAAARVASWPGRPRDVPAVTVHPDASQVAANARARAALTPAPATPPGFMSGREVPTEAPAKPTGKAKGART
jgi:hypothetical protein